MAETQKKSSPVALAVLLFLLASLLLCAAVYYFGGGRVASDLFGKARKVIASVRDRGTGGGSREATVPPADALTLPEGVTQEFALRLWQEEVDSQANIARLMDGQLKELSFVTTTSVRGSEASLTMNAKFKDGTSAPGVLFMSKRGGNWYVKYLTGLRSPSMKGMARSTQIGRADVPPDTPLPKLEEIDKGVLTTIFAEQVKSQDVFEDYLATNVRKVVIDDVVRGPRTTTITTTMIEKQHTVRAQIVLVKTESRGKEAWFLTRFAKIGAAQ